NMQVMNRSTLSLSSDKIDIRYVAKLARIALTDDEVERFGAQLTDLLEHVDAISALDTNSISATAQVVESRNVEREDRVAPCLDRAEVLSMAPQAQGNYFRVPRIIAEES
ncbi:MAG: Asp-tRNA(Asn)/Glu-tRNA(Gln) amidotransferase subunit GatC, partial [Candidatus Eremiobacteraeota bacterium]|nr:Asp-tRNA(Asn)/Glu-tRNA(Gln) amidotransferase subunit GatC [Candidatus Eremiobacteraeota bacterium]